MLHLEVIGIWHVWNDVKKRMSSRHDMRITLLIRVIPIDSCVETAQNCCLLSLNKLLLIFPVSLSVVYYSSPSFITLGMMHPA
jgi:hypothetical protein